MGVIAEDLTRNPWKITATGGALALPLTITTQPMRIAVIRWTSPAASPGDRCIIQDNPPPAGSEVGGGGTGNRDFLVMVADKTPYDSGDRRYGEPHPTCNGMVIATLDSGELLITYA